MGKGAVGSEEIFIAEDLESHYRGLTDVDLVVRAVFQQAVSDARGHGQTDEVLRYLVRLSELWPESVAPWQELIETLVSNRRWRESEQAARRALSSHRGNPGFHRFLAQALVVQDRVGEAADALRQALAIVDDASLRAMLAEIERGLGHERNLGRAQSSHFNLHLEGGASGLDARPLLELLERRYADLARTLDYEPPGEIPVVLYPDGEGLRDSGAPGWAVATYSHADGRIRVGTTDLSRGITPDLEETLVHELTHAFVAARAGANAPVDVNEGLAQYLSGRRARPVAIDIHALERGATSKVSDFYEAALSFVEFLIRSHGQGGMNDLLKALGETDADHAFRRAYGVGYEEAHQQWIKQLP